MINEGGEESCRPELVQVEHDERAIIFQARKAEARQVLILHRRFEAC